MSKEQAAIILTILSYVLNCVLVLKQLLKNRNRYGYLDLDELILAIFLFIISPAFIYMALPIITVVENYRKYQDHKFFKKAKK